MYILKEWILWVYYRKDPFKDIFQKKRSLEWFFSIFLFWSWTLHEWLQHHEWLGFVSCQPFKAKNQPGPVKSKVLREASQDFVKVASQVRLASYHGLDEWIHISRFPMGDGYRDQLHVRWGKETFLSGRFNNAAVVLVVSCFWCQKLFATKYKRIWVIWCGMVCLSQAAQFVIPWPRFQLKSWLCYFFCHCWTGQVSKSEGMKTIYTMENSHVLKTKGPF